MAAAKRYSAGTIFLQVSPVFRRFQEEVQDYVKDIDRALGDDMEKSGERAGQRAGKAMGKAMSEEYGGHFETTIKRFVKNAEREIGRLDLSTASEKMLRDLDEAKKKLRELNDQDFNVDFNSKEVIADLAKVKGAVEALTKGDHDINVDSNIRKVVGEIEAALKFVDKEIEKKRSIDVDTDQAVRKMGAFEKKIKSTMDKAARHLDGSVNKKVIELRNELDRLGKMKVGPEISATRMRAEAETIMRELKAISDTDVEIDARFDSGRAFAELAAFEQSLDHVDGRTVRVHAVANTANAQRNLHALSGSGEDAANSFRSFNIILLAAAGAGPALIPVLGAIAGGLLAIGPAAAVAAFGLGSVLVGFSGLGDVLTSYDALQKQQGMNAQTAAAQNRSAGQAIADASRAVADAERNAARAAEDAARAVADAREAAADAVEAALERQKQAQEAYRDSIQDVRDAELALAEARRAARGEGANIEEKISDNALAQDQALLDVFNSTVTYEATMADGSATNAEQEQARINLERAKDALDDLRKEAKELAKEQKKWRKEGVDGTDEVQQAQERLNDALEAQKDAYEGVRDAAADVDEARADGAEMVSDAIRAQNQTLADNARAIADAKRGLDRARQSSDDLTTSINSQQNAFDEAMDNLGPAGRKFAMFLISLKEGFREFRNDIQAAMLPSIQEAIEGFLGSKNASVARKAMINLAAGFGDFTKILSQSFQGPAWAGFFQMLADLGPDIQAAYGQAFVLFLEAMASILTTLAPYALEFAEGLAAMMDSFAQWAASEEGAAGLERFMDYVKEIGPDVLKFLGVFVLALTNLMVALAPYGEMILGLLTGFLDWIAGMDPKVLGLVVGSILALVTAAQLAYAVMNLLLAGGALLRSSVGLLTFTFLAFALAIYWVYTQNETLGKVLAVLVGGVYAAIVAFRVYRTVVALLALAKFGYITATTGAAVATTGLTAAQKVAMAVGRAWAAVMGIIKLAQQGMLLFTIRYNAVLAIQAVWMRITAVATKAWAAAQWLLNAAMRMNPLGIALTAILAIGAGMVWAYKKFDGFRKVVDTVVGAVADAFFWLWDFLFGHSVMPDIIDGMEWFFDKLSAIFGWIKSKVIEPLARAFQWLWKNVIKPVAKFIWKAVKGAFGIIVSAWKNVLWPVLKVIGKVVFTLWKAYFKVVFTLIKAIVKVVFTLIKGYWNNILHPVFKVVAKVLGWLWEKVFSPILGWIGDKFGDIFRGMKFVWDNVLKPVFNYIGDKALPKLKGAFKTAVDAIKKIWDGLKKVVGTPIKFVIDKVINKGLIAGFNKVAKWVGAERFDEIDIPKSLQSYATGGIMPGYTPGRDVHRFYSPSGGYLNLSGGEAVMRPEFTRAVGPDFVNAANRAARSGGTSAVRRLLGMPEQSYWLGGMIPLNGARISRHASGYSGYAADLNVGSGSDDYGMPVRAWKSGIIAAMRYIGDQSYGRWMDINHGGQFSRYAHLSGFAGGLRTGQKISIGDVLGYVGSVGNSSAPHLHFEINGGSVDLGDMSGAGDGGGGGLPRWLEAIIGKPLDWIKGLYNKAANKVTDAVGESPFLSTVIGLGKKLLSPIVDKVLSLFKGSDNDADNPGSIATGGVQDAVNAVAANYGWARGSQWNALVELVQRESSWNPNAANPSSSARGLFQKMTSIHGPIEDTVAGQARWGLNYIKGRYGSPLAALAFHNSHGYYEDGGVLPDSLGTGDNSSASAGMPYNGTMMYDNGGYLPPGLTSVVNLTGKPEPVFTNDQWSQMGGAPGQGGNIHYEPHFEGSDLTAADVAGDLNFTFRKIRRAGRYEGVGR